MARLAEGTLSWNRLRMKTGISMRPIHFGSRRLGKEVTEYYLTEGQKELKKRGLCGLG